MVTIRHVADAAGVSTATVSRVLNGSPRVSDDTRQRVLVEAARLDYWPNGAARSLTTSRSHAIGVLLPDLFGEFFSEVIRGIDHAARLERFQILLSSSHANTDELLQAACSLHGRIDGLIAMALDRGSARAAKRISQSFPVVLMNAGLPVRECSTVSIANFDGAYAMVDHLLGLGHRRMVMIKGPTGNVDARERLRGYRKALRKAGVPSAECLEVPGDFTESSGYQAAAVILRHRPRPTAVFAANDYMAIGLLSALRQTGINVPADIAVAGFDDIAITQYLNPPLTTVHVDAYELGEHAVRLLISAARSVTASRPIHEVLPTRLVVRSSCGSSLPFAADARPQRRRVPQIFAGEEPAIPYRPGPDGPKAARPAAHVTSPAFLPAATEKIRR